MLYSFFNGKWMQISKLQSQRKSLSTPEEPTALDILLITIQVCRIFSIFAYLCSKIVTAALIQYAKSHSHVWWCGRVLGFHGYQRCCGLLSPISVYAWNWSSNPESRCSENTLTIDWVTFPWLWPKYHPEKQHEGRRFVPVDSFRVLESITTGNAWHSDSARVQGAWHNSCLCCHKPGSREWPEPGTRWGQ